MTIKFFGKQGITVLRVVVISADVGCGGYRIDHVFAITAG